ncbi:MAG: 2'-5' RNA ligase family protein [Opitutaceae bacterium]|nr:2'-5' RNA ligase family protein [Opitutaceae bacterium]MBP9912657.1 2'-5' RNA ligase family protein [Opitutaceae bacterium]
MPLAIELFFDPATEAAIRSLWSALAAAGVCDHMANSHSRPHISLSVLEEMPEAELHRILNRFGATQPSLSLTLSVQGRFPHTAVAFLAPKPSVKLLAMQQWLHTELVRAGAVVSPLYLPSAWVPHCTLATKAALSATEKLTRILDDQALPATIRVESVGLVRFAPVIHLQDFRLCA